MDIKEEIKKVLKDRVEFTRAGKVTFEGVTTTPARFYSAHRNQLVDHFSARVALDLASKYSKSGASGIFESILSEMLREYRTLNSPEISQPIKPKEYQGLVCHQTGEIYLIDPTTEAVAEVSYQAYVQFLSLEDKGFFRESLALGKVVYDPYDVIPLSEVMIDDQMALRLNLYTPPLWRTREFMPSCPEPIKKLLRHLFPVEDHRTYVLDWMYRTILSRNECYLVLNGAKGVGKGVFMALMRAISGQHNYSEAPDSLLDSQFNSVLDRKRVIALDEFRVDKEKHTKLKRYANKFQNIEKKGVDADKLVETYNSFIIANNDETDMYIEFDDRRF